MQRENGRDLRMYAFKERLFRLSEAGLRINESLDFDTVFQVVLDGACALTDARRFRFWVRCSTTAVSSPAASTWERKDPRPEFTAEDEETLAMFASQATMVVANARKH